YSPPPPPPYSYKLYLYHANTKLEIAGSPISFDVFPDAPSLAKSTASAGNATSIETVTDTRLPLQVFLHDVYGNDVLDSTDVSVQVQGLNPDDPSISVEHNLEPPGYIHTITVPADLGASLIFNFTLNGAPIGEPVTIVAVPPPPEDNSPMIIAVTCSLAALLLIFLALFLRQRRRAQLQVKKMQSAHLLLEVANENLKDSLRKKKHSDKEMEAMKKAMEEQKEDRKDELRTVLIPSSEIDIVELLGQGGMGKVHLANYKQKLVAVKQLITINDDSVMRFRRECFLTKEMSHPNIVILIGVCWDQMMLGCVLEYVDGGSLQDRLKADWNADFADKITWKGELLKWAREAALGCQYLHHKRYFDETTDEWKEGIVHRDLKPDNMLVTTEGVLKLTDFGEARTAEVDMTMTAVGTPIFLCPEIIRGARYDVKADSYSFGICLVAMMRIEDTIVNFFFNALIKKMRKASRDGVGLTALNRNVEKGWRPTLPEEFYPSLIDLIWRCWDDDPEKRPDMDEAVRLLMGPIADEVRSNPEPVFGSGKVIGACTQKDMALADDENEMVSLKAVEKIIEDKDHELDLAVAQKDKVIKELREKMKKQLHEKEKEIKELRTTGRKEGKEGGGTRKLEKTASAKKVDADMKNMLAMMGR
ncbi:hypothetical protein TeGR_g294, partial [Tetraparma gracilis]